MTFNRAFGIFFFFPADNSSDSPLSDGYHNAFISSAYIISILSIPFIFTADFSRRFRDSEYVSNLNPPGLSL